MTEEQLRQRAQQTAEKLEKLLVGGFNAAKLAGAEPRALAQRWIDMIFGASVVIAWRVLGDASEATQGAVLNLVEIKFKALRELEKAATEHN